MSQPARTFEISSPILTPEAGFTALDIRLRWQDTPDPAGGQQASTIAHKRGGSVAFGQAAKEQRDLLGNWAYRAFSSAWPTRPPSSIQIDYAAGRDTTLDGGAGRSSWHLAYIVAVLHGLLAMREQILPEGARLWALGEMRGETFVEVGQHELLDKARIIGGTAGPGARHYLLVQQGDARWAAQRAFLGTLSEMGRVPEALASVTLLRFRDLETLRDLLDVDSFDAWDSDTCARRKDAPPARAPRAASVAPPLVTGPARPPETPGPQLEQAEPARQSRGKAWLPAVLLGVLGAVAVAAAGVVLTKRGEAPPAPSSRATETSSVVLVAPGRDGGDPPRAERSPATGVPDAGQAPAPDPPPPEPTRPKDTSPPRLWGRLPKPEPAPPPKPEASKPSIPLPKDAGAPQAEAARVKQAKTNLGASLDTAEHRRVPSTPGD